MAKRSFIAQSRYSKDACQILGELIKQARLEKNISESELATRACVSRSFVQRAQKGDPACSIGAVFELASVLGIRLFDLADKFDHEIMDWPSSRELSFIKDRHRLLPKRAVPININDEEFSGDF